MKIFSLSSGSKGNCTFVKANKTCILIDAGISYSLIEKGLKDCGEDITNVSAVLITHEHSDHTKGLSVLIKKKPNIKVYAHRLVCNKLCVIMPNITNNLVEILTPIFYVGDFLINAFKSPHDSVVCLNFSIYEEDKKFSIITDCGVIMPYHLKEVEGSNLLFVESNHNINMLKNYYGYSANLKARILSDRGHLSNNSAGEFISKVLIENPNCKIVLCHLSSKTNTHQTAISEVTQIIHERIGISPLIKIAPELKISDIFEI